ncbi:MAG: hypothetical protein CVV56_06980 [Tenericutes bacterium HGW-Tenericutes-1]|jgi:acetyl esterase/lipase|nr:MAG: hypothetical protein CVV56_06980 [Tenericutes bacterium HGW-Tenericutes-1]
MKYPIHKDFWWMNYMHMSKNLSLLKIENWMLKIAYSLTSKGKGIIKRQIQVKTRDNHYVQVDLFYPKNKETNSKGLLYLPGGGFIMRATHIHKINLCHLVRRTQSVGMMIHYRLAPKYPFPTALYDAIDVLNYIHTNALSLGLNSDLLGIGGDSAGGNLACGLALYNQDYLHIPIKTLMLVYPGLVKGQSTPSRKNYTDTPMFNASMFPLIEKVYYKNGTLDLEHYAFPMEHPNIHSLGSVYIETAEYDCLVDEGLMFHDRLVKLNISSTLHATKGTVHGYDVVQRSQITKESISKRCEFINNHLK